MFRVSWPRLGDEMPVQCIKREPVSRPGSPPNLERTAFHLFLQIRRVFQMHKLYKTVGHSLRYWEIWEHDETTVVHSGVVGDAGEVSYIPNDSAAQEVIERQAARLREEGYAKRENASLFVLLIRYQIDGMGSVADLDKRHKIEELMDECLGWTGLGHCDGGDIGGGDMNICCFVVDPTAAIAPIIKCLEENTYLAGATLLLETEVGRETLWPTNSTSRADTSGTLQLKETNLAQQGLQL